MSETEMNVEPVGTALPATTADVLVRTQPRVDRAVLLLLAKFYGIILAAELVFTATALLTKISCLQQDISVTRTLPLS